MSILIKNKEMPKNCNQCVYRHLTMKEGNFCTAIHERINYRDEKLPHCPIIEIKPHGDLIDRDAFRKEMDRHYPFDKETQSRHGEADIAKSVIIRMLAEAEVIVPAEEGE